MTEGSGKEPEDDSGPGMDEGSEKESPRPMESTPTESIEGSGNDPAERKENGLGYLKIVNLLACPACKEPIRQEDPPEENRISCTSCDRWYPVDDGMPLMLPDHEKNLEGEKLNHQFRNVPGIAPKRGKRFRWYYDSPKMVGGIEEGEGEGEREWKDFTYSDLQGRILDIGAGDRKAQELLGENSDFVSIDIIPRDRPTVVADAHYLPFKDGIFDAALGRALIEHVRDTEQVVSEVSRVLRPGGLFMFSAPFIYPIHDAVDYHRFTIYSIRALAESHGFEIVRLTSTGGYFGILAQHIFQGLQLIRDHIDARFEKKPIVRGIFRFFSDLFGMIIYLPFHLFKRFDRRYRKIAQKEQGRIPFVKGYGMIFRKR